MHSLSHLRRRGLFARIEVTRLDLAPLDSTSSIQKQSSSKPAAEVVPAGGHLEVEYRPFGRRCYQFLAGIDRVLGYWGYPSVKLTV
jgi:hypothetical protein